VLPSLLTTVLWALSAVCGARSAKIIGGTEANFWRLVMAALTLGLCAHLFGQGLAGASLPLFLLSGAIGIGGDIFLFQSYPLIGSRLTTLIVLCGGAAIGALIDWVCGTRLTGSQMVACAVILAGVALALAPGKHLNATNRAITIGIILSTLGALSNGIGAELSHSAYTLAEKTQMNISPITAAYQRLLGGLMVAAVCVVAVRWHRRQTHDAAQQSLARLTKEKWRQGWPWVLGNSLSGQIIGMTCYQWALKTTKTGVVLAIIATSPLVVIPLSKVMEGETVTKRSILGGVIAVIGAVALVLAK
jgi:drug/metabolite transporter (DMT)-like permease